MSWSVSWLRSALRHIRRNVDFRSFLDDSDVELLEKGELHYPSPEDAHLMAAAPELLKALKDLLVWADWHSERHRSVSLDEPNIGAQETARAAIAKAESKT